MLAEIFEFFLRKNGPVYFLPICFSNRDLVMVDIRPCNPCYSERWVYKQSTWPREAETGGRSERGP